jgi:hypothetical protein
MAYRSCGRNWPTEWHSEPLEKVPFDLGAVATLRPPLPTFEPKACRLACIAQLPAFCRKEGSVGGSS